MLKWITIKLLEYHLRKAERRKARNESDIMKGAFDNCIKSLNSAIIFVKALK